jgi:hypothetical protein
MNARVLLCLVIAALATSVAHAQETPWRWGVWGFGSLAVADADFSHVPGTTACVDGDARMEHTGGSALGVGIEGAWSRPGTSFEIAGRLGVALGTSTFARRQDIGQVLLPDGSTTRGITELRAVLDRTELRFEPQVRWRPATPLVLTAGIVGALPLAATYDQREVVVAPEQMMFFDESGETTQERTVESGRLEGIAPWVGLSAAIAIDLVVGEQVLVRPELGGVLALTSVVDEIGWNPHELRLGVAVVFGAIGSSTPIQDYPRE